MLLWGDRMKRFIAGEDRQQTTLLPDCLDDYIAAENPVRLVEVFVDELELSALGFGGAVPEATGRPAYHPATLLKIYLYGYLNRVPSSRRLERESQRNVELMWLTGRLMPDFKTLADFRKDNGPAIQAACAQFVVLCRRLKLFSQAVVAIDGSKFKAVNNRDKNFTAAKVEARLAQVEASIGHYLVALGPGRPRTERREPRRAPTRLSGEDRGSARADEGSPGNGQSRSRLRSDRPSLADRSRRAVHGHERQGHGRSSATTFRRRWMPSIT